MKKTKIIAMYLPQYHRIPENDLWWGEGFTDWVGVKTANPQFNGHIQPKKPLNDNYYDLSDINNIQWQVNIARAYGIHGFCIYHYWFSSNQMLLNKPAELILNDKDINIPFFFAWDNCSWVRTWSKLKHNTNAWAPRYDGAGEHEPEILANLNYGDENDWRIHYEYLLNFFKDERYIKIDNKPVFIFFNYNNKEIMQKMIRFWDRLAQESGFNGLYIMSRENPYDSMKGLSALFTYEPMFTAWQNKNILSRIFRKFSERIHKEKKLTVYSYDKTWDGIISHAKNKKTTSMFGAFVNYDDTPRRGHQGKVVIGGTPEKFYFYLNKLMDISIKKSNEFIFLTAWNEWGEGAYLEPDSINGFAYLEAVKRVVDNFNNE